MQKNNLQDIFLTKVRKQSLPVTVFLMNGFQLRGSVTGFDSFTVVLDTDGKQQVIYKHHNKYVTIRNRRSEYPLRYE